MTIQNLPASTNFQVSYEDSIANADIRAQAVAAVCEHEFTVLTGWFGITGAFGTADRINVQLDLPPAGGAWNAGYQSGGQTKIIINPQSAMTNAANAAEIMKMMFVNELVEVFMSYNNQKGANRNSWKANNSDGEALSQLCGIERFRTGHYLAYSSWVDQWLPKADLSNLRLHPATHHTIEIEQPEGRTDKRGQFVLPAAPPSRTPMLFLSRHKWQRRPGTSPKLSASTAS